MGTIYIDGRFNQTAKPVKVVKNEVDSLKIMQKVLENYATKEDLNKAIEDLSPSIDGADHKVIEETLIIS